MQGRLLWLRYCAAVPLRRLGGPGTPAMPPAVDHPEADQNKHRSTDGPTHGGTIAIVPDAYGEKENGQGQSCPVEGPAQSVGYRRLVHSLILADPYDHHQMRTRCGGKSSSRSLILIRLVMRARRPRSALCKPLLASLRSSPLIGVARARWCQPLMSGIRAPLTIRQSVARTERGLSHGT